MPKSKRIPTEGHVFLTATKDAESWRIERLRKLVKALRKSHYASNALLVRVHDHKGKLTVWWRGPDMKQYVEKVNAIWTEAGEEYVDHRLEEGDMILSTHFGKLVEGETSSPWPSSET